MNWIIFQKKKWAFQIMQKHNINQFNRKKAKNSSTITAGIMGAFIQKTQRTLQSLPWQVVQVVETTIPGNFKLWILVESELHLIKLRVPKIYYVNLKLPKVADEGDLFKKCNGILPRSRAVYNLYMYSVPEELYRKHEKDVFLDLSDPNVEGIYETQVSSMFRVLSQIGAVCKLQKRCPILDTYELKHLEMSNISKNSYLPKGSLKHIYFYHHKHATKKQHMFGLFITPLKKALILVVDTVRTNLMPNMNNLYQAERIIKKEKNSEDDLLPPEGIQFEVRVETDLNVVYKLLQKYLQSYKDEKKGPSLLIMQCSANISLLTSNIPVLAEFPQTQVHIQDLDDLYNVLEWQKVGAKALIRNYLNSERVIELLTEQCRYFLLPIGNMPSDPAIFGSDLFFARHLKQRNHLLWCSPSDKPDFGGSQENNARLLAENQETSSEICNVPGWYSTICIELDIDSLAINTLLQAHHVTDIEGTTSVSAFDSAATPSLDDLIGGNQATYDETTRCAEAFKILRGMASTWMRDISVYRNIYADFQVIHFYRWLRSPKALLYDPALLRTLQNLMKKLFLQLVAELKRLGCMIIYANFNRIIICTRRKNVEDAMGNIEFVIASIRNKELFHSLQITYRQCWEQLVWLDTANYAGIQGKLPKNIDNIEQEGEEEEHEETEKEDGPVVLMNWNIAEQLSEKAGCRNSFNTVIAGYIDAVYQKLRSTNNPIMLAPVLSQPYRGLSAHEDVAEYAKNLINGDMSQMLFKVVEKLNRILPPRQDGDFQALKYINALCHVLDLDPAVQDAVINLKSNLLRLIGVGEFSNKAVWKDPTVSYVIPQIICKACNHCRDLDLGRDSFRSEHAWLCPLCSTPYDNSEIECLLLDIVSRKFLAYNLQDLQCKKCSQIKMEDLNKHCTCASDFKCLVSKDDLIKLFEKFQILSETFNMPTLRETMDQLLQIT
ncbi:hypothetical protein WA026_002253 [Henosepilachna vigintioctopunctata]|uniref:DNA polymerase epsilon catalytic subunit n=1 Tax=Henosepilachna vigintioctopunctata TaxID=420089 RepID=A0AAW1U1T5_9CUCU